MRVFDCCFFNITDKVKFKNTAAYIENMLAELSMNYTDIAFRLNCGPVSKAVEKYPELKKYYCIDPENNSSYLNENLTSFSENWKDGEIFIDRKDSRTVL